MHVMDIPIFFLNQGFTSKTSSISDERGVAIQVISLYPDLVHRLFKLDIVGVAVVIVLVVEDSILLGGQRLELVAVARSHLLSLHATHHQTKNYHSKSCREKS